MSFIDAIKSVFSQYATFSGRARRSEFWFWTLFTFVVYVVVGIIAGPMMVSGMDVQTGELSGSYFGGSAIYGIVGLALLLPTLAVSVRRLHDQDKSGFFWFMGLIPFVGWIIMIVFYATPGTVGPNRFGPDPKAVTAPQTAV
ncbi:DUF805 domain-containing protein [Isoptericola sp. BMS4]|uniref:DUF805 domain-containing protein n=1 Tax=Isoptericola sp. BMS4 TaxID=2527875 RepID=UPI001424311C|nr:DUF805 domain-containing protein [Isoptericola sp. BMS4]